MNKGFIIFLITVVISGFAFGQEAKTKEKNKQKFGLFFDNLTADQKAFNAETSGVVIKRVSDKQAGYKAGVQVGDILTHIDTVAIKDQEHCVTVMRDYDTSKGAAVVKVIRNGVKMDLKVVFEE